MRSGKVLVVDDDKVVHLYVQNAMSTADAPYDLSFAETGEEGLDRIREGSFDAVLLDIMLPGRDGIETLEEIRKLSDPPETIMLTSETDLKTVVKAVKLGAYDYVTKPFDPEELIHTLENAIERRDLVRENALLKRISARREDFPEISYCGEKMQRVVEMVERVAPTDSTVLITGESGTGKEVIAKALHKRSQRKDKVFFPINCGSLQSTMLDSELFGHEKGAFTGAADRKLGLFEITSEGTIFLDEIGELDKELQVKLLRVLQSGEFRRVGGGEVIKSNARIIAATNRDIAQQVKDGRFREDLYFRLNVINIHIPPLRERKEDIPHLIRDILKKLSNKLNTDKDISDEVMDAFLRWDWPGNVRELENALERLLILSSGDTITLSDLKLGGLQNVLEQDAPIDIPTNLTLAEMERMYIKKVLEANNGNKTQTAKALGINIKTLYAKIKGPQESEP